jgi:hypothetical protein
MKKYLFIIASFLLLTAMNTSSTNELQAPFQEGEWFKFRIHYGMMTAGYATLAVNKEMYKQKKVYHVVGRGTTNGMAKVFFKVEDRYESYFDRKTIVPYRFIRKINEGGYTKDTEILFNHNASYATVKDYKNNKTSVTAISKNVQDMISSFYYLRSKDISTMSIGETVEMDMFFDNENYGFKMKFLGRETIKTKFGKIKTLKFRPYVQSGRVFKAQESLTVWVSDDANKIPLRIKAELAVGSLKADLNAFKGLKHPFKIVVK